MRVADTFHFAYADGTRYLPVGTTAYAWTHQPEPLQEQTLDTLAMSPFTKLRMCVFPKSYLYNTNDPEVYPFVRRDDGSFDTTRFDPAYFALLEQRILQLQQLGIEADLILFHAYDRWGFSELGRAADDRYVRYLVRRLGAYRSVWWSLANEYDLLWSKTVDDWERLAAIIVAEDPAHHLLSIHNCFGFYDYSRPWITHASMQRIDVYRTAENTDAWRTEWGKPVVIDECAYEGDIDQGWGNITGEEMTRRFWEGAVRGGYVGHGETYLNEREELWWSKGGELVGQSPARIRFLADITAESPTGVLDPLPGEWDLPWGGVADEYLIGVLRLQPAELSHGERAARPTVCGGCDRHVEHDRRAPRWGVRGHLPRAVARAAVHGRAPGRGRCACRACLSRPEANRGPGCAQTRIRLNSKRRSCA